MTRAHGTSARYKLDGCRCEPCRRAATDYNRRYEQRLEPAYVDATAARDHVRALSKAGLGWKTVAKTAGVSTGAISKLLYGTTTRPPSKRIRRTTEQRLLAVTPSAAAGSQLIDARPSWRLINEMRSAGASWASIATAIHERPTASLQLNRDQITARNAARIRHVHTAWRNGTLTLHTRGHRNAPAQPVTPPAAKPRPERADVSHLYNALTDAIQLRHEQPWRTDAACRTRPAYLWHPEPDDTETETAGLTICRSCLVRDQCRAAGLDEPDGTWGALTAHRRLELRTEDEAAA